MYTEQDCISKLKKMQLRLERIPSRREVDAAAGPSSTTIGRYFRSFAKACLAADLGLPKYGGPGGTRHGSWHGGRIKNSQGYIRLWLGTRKYVLEHRYIMEKHLGRKLLANEIVHHKNGIKDDNRLQNLEVVLRTTHRGSVTCPHCLKNFSIR